jgi:hypothetical protein
MTLLILPHKNCWVTLQANSTTTPRPLRTVLCHLGNSRCYCVHWSEIHELQKYFLNKKKQHKKPPPYLYPGYIYRPKGVFKYMAWRDVARLRATQVKIDCYFCHVTRDVAWQDWSLFRCQSLPGFQHRRRRRRRWRHTLASRRHLLSVWRVCRLVPGVNFMNQFWQ